MTITRQGTPTLVEQVTGTSIAATVPGGVATGEVLVLDLAVASGTVTPPAGWTQIAAVVSSGADKYSAYHVVTDGASEPGSYTFSGFTTGRSTAIMQRYSGVDNGTPLDVTASTASSLTGSTTLDAPSITTVTDGAMLISGGGQDSSTGTVTQPGSMSMVSQSTGTGKKSGFADETFATAGATGVRTWTFDSSTLAHVVWLGALRPAAGGTTQQAPPRFVLPWPLMHALLAVQQNLWTSGAGAVAATGSTTAEQRTATAVDATKQVAGTTTPTQRSATATTGVRAATGATTASGRSAVTATGLKGAAAPSSGQQRTTTLSTGTSATAASGAALTVQRSSTLSTGRRTAASVSLDQQRSATLQTGRKTAAGIGLDQQRSTLTVTSIKGTAGAALDQVRAATFSAGAAVTGISGPGLTTQRSSVAATGRKTAAVMALVQVRGVTTGAGTHRATGGAIAVTRTHDQAGGLRATTGVARVVQRSTIVAVGEQPASTANRGTLTVGTRRTTNIASGRRDVPTLIPTDRETTILTGN